MKKLVSEFGEFLSKGNVIGLAIGLMMGNAFNAIINSLINDVFMPLIGRITSGVSFESWYIPLDGRHFDTFAAAKAANQPMITIGNFISAIFNFLIVALVLFWIMKTAARAEENLKKLEMIKKINDQKTAAAAAPAEPSEEVKLLTEIRDELAKKSSMKAESVSSKKK